VSVVRAMLKAVREAQVSGRGGEGNFIIIFFLRLEIPSAQKKKWWILRVPSLPVPLSQGYSTAGTGVTIIETPIELPANYM